MHNTVQQQQDYLLGAAIAIQLQTFNSIGCLAGLHAFPPLRILSAFLRSFWSFLYFLINSARLLPVQGQLANYVASYANTTATMHLLIFVARRL